MDYKAAAARKGACHDKRHKIRAAYCTLRRKAQGEAKDVNRVSKRRNVHADAHFAIILP